MIGRLLDACFGCWHGRYSFPITVRTGAQRNAAASLTGTYVVCLDCGKELPYDWKQMKVLDVPVRGRKALGKLATKEAA
jgi:hypothetical protein